MHHHFSIGPVDRVSLILRAHILVIGYLGFLRQLLRASGWTVTVIQCASDVGQGVVSSLVSAGVKIPVIVWRPKLVGRDELLQAIECRNGFIVALFSRRTACRAILFAEPVIRRAPNVRPNHVNTTQIADSLRPCVYHSVRPQPHFLVLWM